MKFFVLILILVSPYLFSQNFEGVILSTNNLPIENVLIENLKTKNHTHTDRKGYFLLQNCSKTDSIKFSQQNYESKSVLYQSDFQKIQLNNLNFSLKEVVVSSNKNHFNSISKIDLNLNPVTTSQELLSKVPGLFIGQHAGGGKAEQIFLRGFDIDHGTDIAISVDGIPVNMVSHAHGQGYADLHFLIPETVQTIDFDKGSYNVQEGNFATAGYVKFQTKDQLENNLIQLEAGQFNTIRLLSMFNLLKKNNQNAYFAMDYNFSDGFFDASQNFSRLNLMGKYTATLTSKDKISIGLSHFSSKWDASGQIPNRAVNQGLISRFGAIDSTEGGTTSRSNFNLNYLKMINENTFVNSTAYFSKYDFELFSNFTFFLEDPENGDQIKQKENRSIYGLKSELNHKIPLKTGSIEIKSGVGIRLDQINELELSHTKNRKVTLEQIALGAVDESNLFSYVDVDFKFGKWIFNPAIRYDYFKHTYNDLLQQKYSNINQNKGIFSPKFNVIYSPNSNLQSFLKLGKGFHSNDSRVVIAQSAKKILPASYNTDLGLIWKLSPKLILNSTLWYLYLEQEFVYVGDAGIVEPSGRTSRKGLDVGMRWEFVKGFFLNGDYTYTHAKSIDEPKGEDYIPLAPKNTAVFGLSIKNLNGFSGGIYARYLGDRPSNEDNSINAKGYFISDLNLNYTYKNINFGIAIQNLFNAQWNETQFATESRLQNETESVEEIHFTPGTPFNTRFKISYQF